MANDTNISYMPPGFRRYGGDRLFALTLLLGLAITATGVIVASRHLNDRVDLTQLVVVDVKRARVEMAREIAPSPRKRTTEPAKPRTEPVKAAEVRVKQVPLPAVHLKAPPLAVKAPPVIRVKPVPAGVKPTPAQSARVTPTPPSAPAVRPAPGPTAPAQHNAGSRLQTGATSTMGTTAVGGEGHGQAGTTGAGIGDAAGQGTGSGRGVGAVIPSQHPTGDSITPPPEARPTPAAPVVSAPPKPAPEPKPEPRPEPKPRPEPQQNVTPDRQEAQLIGGLPRPEMPSFLFDEGGGGKVVVEFTVRADGSITNIRVKKSDDSRLNSAALAAARRIKALPAVQGGIPRDTTRTATFTFQAG